MITPATLDDIIHVSVHMRPDDYAEVMAARWDRSPFTFAVDHFRLNGPKYVVREKDGTPVAVGGIAVHRPRVGQAWLIGTPAIGPHGREVMRVASGTIRDLMDETRPDALHRVQAFSSETHVMAHRWLRRIGFQKESEQRGFGEKGETFFVFSIVAENLQAKEPST